MLAQKDEDKLLKRLLNASDRERNSAKKKQAAELKKAEKRKAEVDLLKRSIPIHSMGIKIIPHSTRESYSTPYWVSEALKPNIAMTDSPS